MNKVDILKKFMEHTKELIFGEYFKETYRLQETDFTRNRKLRFSDIICFILKLPQKTLNIEIEDFLNAIYGESDIDITKQALSKARQNISDKAFHRLFKESYHLAQTDSSSKLWYGHEVKAIDGTTIRVPNTPENREVFNYQYNQFKNVALAKASALYDVSNDMIQDVVMEGCRTSEKSHAMKLLESETLRNTKGKRPIITFDRGYPSRELISFIQSKNYIFVMRCSSSFLKCVNQCDYGDTVCHYRYNKVLYKLRVIKFKLSSNEDEVLITNIFEEKYTVDDFKVLYFMRWSIEIKYGELKTRLKVENFAGTKPIAVKQEFYAALFFSNLCAAFKHITDMEIKKDIEKKGTKLNYQANRNFLIGIILAKFCDMMYGHDIEHIIKKIIRKSIKERSVVRPNRKTERQKRPQKNSIYFMNMKSSI